MRQVRRYNTMMKSINHIYLMGCTSSKEQNAHACCPPGSWPALQVTYEPKGNTIDLGGSKVYHSGSGSKCLILFEDIFGIDSGKHKTIADTYAQLGFNVYLPQLLNPIYTGTVEDMPKLLQALQKQKYQNVKASYEKLRNHLKSEGVESVLAAGFCWGAWAAFRLSADFGNIRAIAAVHPSLNVENFYGGKEGKLVQSVKCPAFFYSCSNDQPGTKKGGQYVKIIAGKFGEDKTGSQEFPDQQHGFIMRSELSNASAARDTQKVIKMTLEYFAKFP